MVFYVSIWNSAKVGVKHQSIKQCIKFDLFPKSATGFYDKKCHLSDGFVFKSKHLIFPWVAIEIKYNFCFLYGLFDLHTS